MTRDYFQLQGRVALITGASSGLGVHFARVLAEAGATVVLAARRRDKLAAEVEAIRSSGGEATSVAIDVTDPASVDGAFARIAEEIGNIDILVNNAGVADDPMRFLDTGEEEWHRVIDTNLNGAWRVARAAARHMAATGTAGSIVNIGSIYGLRTGAMKVAYNVSKTGVVQLTRAMAIELCRQQIRVNALCPGWFLTDINREYFESESGERYIKTIPARRMGALEDLTAPLLLLASNAAGAYMTGSVLTVDGGIAEAPI